MRRHNVKRGVIVLFITLFIAILSITFSHAFGISTPYLENDTLKVNAGLNYEYSLVIQNGDDKGYYVDINYSSTDNVANLKNITYFVPSNTYNSTFYFDIAIPKDAPIGKTYTLEYTAKPRLNETAPITLGVEIKRTLKIIVSDENNTAAVNVLQKYSTETNNKKPASIWSTIEKYFIVIIILLLLTAIINRVWRLSKGMSSKLSNERVTDYTISQAINLAEVKTLLEKMSDDEFKLQEIRNIFKDKISELTTHNLSKDIKEMSRKDVIKAIDKIK